MTATPAVEIDVHGGCLLLTCTITYLLQEDTSASMKICTLTMNVCTKVHCNLSSMSVEKPTLNRFQNEDDADIKNVTHGVQLDIQPHHTNLVLVRFVFERGWLK